jgi:hypothetical protein
MAEALLEVYGQVPPYRGRGRPPSKKCAQPDWQYLQVVKQRENGRVIGTETRVNYGDRQLTPALLGEHTAYVERTNLTIRHMNGRLVRKTPGLSRQYTMLEAACIWDAVGYNFARHVKTFALKSMKTVAVGYSVLPRWQQASLTTSGPLRNY